MSLSMSRLFVLLGVVILLASAAACSPTVTDPGTTALPATDLPPYPAPFSAPTASPEPYPPPGVTFAPARTRPPEPTDPPIPIPTDPPFPTPIPTPVVTPIPVAEPPFIPGVVGKAQQPFWIYYWQGNEVWRIDDQGRDRELLLDTQQRLGQWLSEIPDLIKDTDCCWIGPRVVVSPDGQKLALVVVDKIEVASWDEPFTWSIYVFDVETGDLKLVSEGLLPIWSPDGRRIAFLKEEYGGLWIADLESGAIRQRVERHEDSDLHITDYAWSADGEQIAYLYHRGSYEPIPDIWLVNADDVTPPRLLLRQPYPIYQITWAPDGQQIFFLSQEGARDTTHYHRGWNLWSVSVAGGATMQLTQDTSIDGITVSPDNEWFSFSGYPLYEDSLERYVRDLWLFNLDGRELSRITANQVSHFAAGWSPDETRLVVWLEESTPLLLSLEDGSTMALDYGLGSDFSVGGLR
jgi:hypothetical protein